MKPPDFWYQHPGFLAAFFAPIGYSVARYMRRHTKKCGYVASIPVICVGNLVVGGAGKTPTVIAIVEMLKAQGRNPHILMRGYGGSARGPLKVNPAYHDVSRVGDEALLLSSFAPVWVGGNRALSAQSAQNEGADCLVMDDGFQNFTLEKDFSIIVIDGMRGFGNGFVIPAGPLREDVKDGLKRAEATLVIGKMSRELEVTLSKKRCFKADLVPLETGMDWKDVPCFAFAGIAHPEKFFQTLKGLGANLVGQCALNDHQPISAALFKRLQKAAHRLGAQLVTTEKDAVRLPAYARTHIISLPVRLRFREPQIIADRLEKIFG